MPTPLISAAQRKQFRAAAHHLHVVVQVGAGGLSDAVLKEANAALAAHALIKIRMASDDRQQRAAALQHLADALGAAPVQQIGKLLVLWRPTLPKVERERNDRSPGPRVVKIVKFSKSGNHRPQVKLVTVHGNQRLSAGGTLKRARKRPAGTKKLASA